MCLWQETRQAVLHSWSVPWQADETRHRGWTTTYQPNDLQPQRQLPFRTTAFAKKVQQKANELYPGLFKPIIFRNSEYNQHVSKAACIIEVGATGNTLEESMAAMKYLAKIIEEI